MEALYEVNVSLEIPHEDLIYSKEDLIGTGGFGKVFRGTWQGTPVAIKQLLDQYLPEEVLTDFKKEVNIHAQFRHPNVILLNGVCLKPYCMVMPFMPRGALFDVLRSSKEELTWPVRIQIAVDIGYGLAYLHNQGYVHCDLKSLNVLIDDNMRAKLSDFGLSELKKRTLTSSRPTSSRSGGPPPGTTRWMAPELFKLGAQHTMLSDVFSYGMVLWELTSFKMPFQDAPTEYAILDWLWKGVRETIPPGTPQPLVEVIQATWEGDPQKRPTPKRVADYLSTVLEAQSDEYSESTPSTEKETAELRNWASEDYADAMGRMKDGKIKEARKYFRRAQVKYTDLQQKYGEDYSDRLKDIANYLEQLNLPPKAKKRKTSILRSRLKRALSLTKKKPKPPKNKQAAAQNYEEVQQPIRDDNLSEAETSQDHSLQPKALLPPPPVFVPARALLNHVARRRQDEVYEKAQQPTREDNLSEAETSQDHSSQPKAVPLPPVFVPARALLNHVAGGHQDDHEEPNTQDDHEESNTLDEEPYVPDTDEEFYTYNTDEESYVSGTIEELFTQTTEGEPYAHYNYEAFCVLGSS